MLKKQKKSFTLDDLAEMVKQGFGSVDEQFIDFRKDVDEGFDEVQERFDRIEKLILADHKQRIEHLEVEVKKLKDLLIFK